MTKIYDIFSKKKDKKKDSPSEKIIADDREKNSFVISEIRSLGIEVELKRLNVADYLVKGIAIERKTVSDFISSMISRRLLNQLEELSQYEERILIIEGIYEQELYSDLEEISGIHPNSIRGFLISIILKYKTPIIFSKDYRDTARFISVITKRKPKEMPLNPSKKTLNKKERMQFILEGFPGIGSKTAKKLLEEFKTIKNIINAQEEDLKKVVGKKAETIKKLIEEKYD